MQLEDDYKQTVLIALPFRIITASRFTFNAQTLICSHFSRQILTASIALDSVLDCSISLDGPHASAGKEQSVSLNGHQQKVMYIIPPQPSKIPKLVKVSFCAAAAAAAASTTHLTSRPVTFSSGVSRASTARDCSQNKIAGTGSGSAAPPPPPPCYSFVTAFL